MQSPNTFLISPDSQTGYVYGTEFVFKANLPSFYTSAIWDFGDGLTTYGDLTATHSYNFPGFYTVSLSAWTNEGFLLTDTGEINVDYAYRDSIALISMPENYGLAGVIPTEPFVFNIISSKINEPLYLVLQSLYSRSIPHYAAENNKWKDLIPTWKFIDASTGKTIDEALLIKTDPIYIDNKVVAVSANVSLLYYDSLGTINVDAASETCPLLMTATLSTLGFTYPKESLNYPYYSYSNSEITRGVIAWQIASTMPTSLDLTENYVNDVYTVKWSNVKIPFLITCNFSTLENEAYKAAGLVVEQADVLSYPRTNEIGLLNSVSVKLSSASGYIPEELYTVEVNDKSYSTTEAPLYFRDTDEQGIAASGYIFSTITPLTSFNETVVIATSAIVTNVTNTRGYGFPTTVPIYPYSYVSHPTAGVINKMSVISYSREKCPDIAYFESLNLLTKGKTDFLKTPISDVVNISYYELSGCSAVYGMAFDPIKNRLYATDADQDTLLVYENGSLTPTITKQLSSFTNQTYNVPSCVSIDGKNNVWISLYGNQRLLKFDADLNLLATITPTVNFPLTDGDHGSFYVEPPFIETDSENNIWACYSHPKKSMLVKYNQYGVELFKCNSLALSSVPVCLAVDYDDNLWVACYDSHTIECFHKTTGQKLHTITGMAHPSYIAVDRMTNLWVAHEENRISYIDTLTFERTTYEIDVNRGSISLAETPDKYPPLGTNEIWAGLWVDVSDNVWVTDSKNNYVLVFSSRKPLDTYSFTPVFPTIRKTYHVPIKTITSTLASMSVRSAQGAGDCSGNRWYQKYASKDRAYPIYGRSTPFRIYDLENGVPTIIKNNEEFNTAQYYKSLALPEVLYENDALFDEFLPAVVGGGNPLDESIGDVVYERIANFVQNHADLNTNEIPHLAAQAKQMSVDVQTFGENFPTKITKLMNLFSVNKNYLRGHRNTDTNIRNSVGVELTTNTFMLSAGMTILMKDRVFNTIQTVYIPPLINGTAVYPLSTLEISNARAPLSENYYFYEYAPLIKGYKNNIINWDSEYNTLQYNLSTNEEWYGKDGLVEMSFNQLLTKMLFS
jgi:PKD repeat protein